MKVIIIISRIQFNGSNWKDNKNKQKRVIRSEADIRRRLVTKMDKQSEQRVRQRFKITNKSNSKSRNGKIINNNVEAAADN